MKILEICPYSAGICGVWQRVRQESEEFIKLGHNVMIFSSNIIKGTNKYAEVQQRINSITIKRFNTKSFKFSENVHNFSFKKELLEFNPDIVITHLLHPHSFKALKVCKKNDIPCYLVTHAPFNIKRKFPLNLATYFYNLFKIKSKIDGFTKIITITKWELPYLEKIGVKKEKIIYIPNGIPKDYFKQKKVKSNKNVLFLGRIAPIKNLELLIEVAKNLKNIQFNLVGSAEKVYLEKLLNIIKKNNLKNIKIFPPVYDLKQKIRLIDKSLIFVLPSLREAMPQVLLEAMSRGKIVIASKTDGAKEIIHDKKNGFLFNINDSKHLTMLIKENILGNYKVQINAEKEAKKYSWQKLIKLYSFIK